EFGAAPPGAILTITSGDGQKAAINTSFSRPLVATVVDVFNRPISGVIVSFVVPVGGASVIFPNGSSGVSDSSGHVSVMVDANGIIGSYQVEATFGGSSAADFDLTNTALATFAISGDSSVEAGQPYVLHLTTNEPLPVTGWTINFGDGTTSHVDGNPREVTH